MVGEQMKIRYTVYFADSLDSIIAYWQGQLKLSPKKVSEFTVHINRKIELLQHFTHYGQDVTELYGFDQKTYRILIGKSYGIFYRIDIHNDMVIVGGIFCTTEMNVKF